MRFKFPLARDLKDEMQVEGRFETNSDQSKAEISDGKYKDTKTAEGNDLAIIKEACCEKCKDASNTAQNIAKEAKLLVTEAQMLAKLADKVNAESSEAAPFCNAGFLSSVVGAFSNIDGTGNEAVHKSLDANGSEILESVSKSENTVVFIDFSLAIIEAKKLK